MPFGEIHGIATGHTFATRQELHDADVHRPTQAGISGTQEGGAESIVLSGGYEDDFDGGGEIIYTGQGGRDPNTGNQIADQVLERGNLALVKSLQSGLPVRVIRGSAQPGPYSPEVGYRYDGLYRVEKFWWDRGTAGFRIIRFRLVKLDQDSSFDFGMDVSLDVNTNRRTLQVSRIIRDSEASRFVKNLYNWRCQVCNLLLEGPAGPYAEGAHIKPLGRPHNGPDVSGNILCLCPNHHVLFDLGVFSIAINYSLVGLEGDIRIHPDHNIIPDMLEYRRAHYCP